VTRVRRLGALACLGAVAVWGAGCSGDRSRSPTCGLAQLAGPALIQQQLTIVPYVLTDAPRGLPTALPARVVGNAQQGEVLITYSRQRLAMTYQGPNFPPFVTDTTVYALLVVDDTTQRAQGVLIYESQRPPSTYPQVGTVTASGGAGAGGAGTEQTVPLYGVRVDWASVSNPRCPLLGQPVQPAR
jgi:hypothetical protein